MLRDSAAGSERTLFSGEHVLTPLYWSPNSRYFIYLIDSKGFDATTIRLMADGYDLMVYRVSDGASGRLAQIFSGHPHKGLAWLTIPEDVKPQYYGPWKPS